MARYRQDPPQLERRLFLCDGGIETTLIFREGLDLPCFAAFPLLDSSGGRAALERYFRAYAEIARRHGTGLILESATWRASGDWGERLGYDGERLDAANRAAVELLTGIRAELETEATPIVVSGCVGPRGDGYDPAALMGADEARDYHERQIRSFAASEADLVTAITMTHAAEATGFARAASAAEMPCVVALTVETDGRLPTGQPLAEAIEEIDAGTDRAPLYYMINCAHPTHFEKVLDDGPWMQRLRGIRANASALSHAELDEAETLDDGDPSELGAQYAALTRRFPGLTVLGGCCGTDERHIEAIARACSRG